MDSSHHATPTLQDALREMADDGNYTRTHCESCWQWHLPCAAMYAADRLDEAELRLDEAELIAMRAIDVIHGCRDDCDDEEFDHRWDALRLAVESGGSADD